MTRLTIWIWGCALALVFPACYKSGGELIVTDDPPVVGTDTTIITYAADLKIGGMDIPSDTVFTSLLVDDINFNSVGYSLDARVGDLPTFSLLWEPQNPTQTHLVEGNYKGLWAIMLTDSSLSQVEQWMLDGQDPNHYPQLDSMPFRTFYGEYVNVTLTDIAEAVRRDTLWSGEIIVIDRAKVTLSGILIDTDSMQVKPVSGSFICHFGRIE